MQWTVVEDSGPPQPAAGPGEELTRGRVQRRDQQEADSWQQAAIWTADVGRHGDFCCPAARRGGDALGPHGPWCFFPHAQWWTRAAWEEPEEQPRSGQQQAPATPQQQQQVRVAELLEEFRGEIEEEQGLPPGSFF